MAYQDDIANKLAVRYPGVEKCVTPLLNRYKADNALTTWELYVAHIASASTSDQMVDDQAAFWAAFVP